MKRAIMAFLLISVAVSIVIAAKDNSEPYHFDYDDGTVKKEKHTGFFDVTMQKKDIDDELVMYHGKITWTKGTGAEGEPAEVPVKAFLINKEEKRLRPIAVYYTDKDGKYYFVLPKEADYKIGPVTSKALNMPPKVKKFFKEWFKENRKKEWQEPKWHKA